jgi:putative oxidoreductase
MMESGEFLLRDPEFEKGGETVRKANPKRSVLVHPIVGRLRSLVNGEALLDHNEATEVPANLLL